ncbi:acetyl-CoA C-acetyltransferase [bacterium]|nr:acetyl-CoA C-acetyltransferase [bacterium]
MSEDVFIVAAKRTALGSFNGSLSKVEAPQLGATAIKAALEQSGVKADEVDECIMGNVLTAGVGQAPARQALIYAGLPSKVPCMTINKVCGSGLKAVMLGFDSIKLGNSSVVIAGGQENMSKAPHLLKGSRDGFKMGDTKLIDSMINDGLWDPYNDFHMGTAAEMCVKKYKFSREEQDAFATNSYKKSQKAIEEGLFNEEIAAVEIKSRKDTITIDQDEEPARVKFDKISKLRAVFEKEGTITAANASTINDGAAAFCLASESKVKALGLKPLAKIKAHSTFAGDPEWFTTAPSAAMKNLLDKEGLTSQDIDLWEINEAFSAVTMAAAKDLEIPEEKINVNGGAVSIGHPIGASGARILTTLVYALKQRNKKLGVASLCIGGGEAVAVLVERV